MTKKDNLPLLSLTITTNALSSRAAPIPTSYDTEPNSEDQNGGGITRGPDGREEYDEFAEPSIRDGDPGYFAAGLDRETTITQSIPVVVLAAATVAQIHEPRTREPDVHIMLPSLLQLKAISERFTKLALAPTSFNPTTRRSHANEVDNHASTSSHSRLIISANMHGSLKIGVQTPHLKIESKWEGLANPELDPGHIEGGAEGIMDHASTRMKESGNWATVRVEGRDWGRVLGVGRLGGRVIACRFHYNSLRHTDIAASVDGAMETSPLSNRHRSSSAAMLMISTNRLLSRPRADPLRLPQQW